ncbi:putative two-component system response regulator [Ruminococcaceae bacterium YRB3002]|nr:putative two-component system response regulator [Ruminococcaceae bacterium YRB3002]
MATLFYDINFAISLLLLLIYAYIWHKHFDVNLTMVFVMIPIADLGYCFLSRASNIQEALVGNKIIYLGGCFLPLFVTLTIFGLCKLRMHSVIRVMIILSGLVSYGSVLSIGYTRWFYTSVSRDVTNGYVMLQKSYGPMHTVFYIFIAIYFLLGIGALVYSFFIRKDISHKIIMMLFLPETLTMISYVISKFIGAKVELVPLTYNIAMVVFLLIAYRIRLYDVTDSAIDAIVEKGNTGFASFDSNLRYLGSNDTAEAMLPFLKDLTVDTPIRKNTEMGETVVGWIEAFEKDNGNDKLHYTAGGKIYLIDINHLIVGKSRAGYQLLITDDTSDQKYLAMLKGFNEQLEEEVQKKTQHIVEMHDNLIMSMATMVESRDNSTGGHIRRTSECVRILIDAMKRMGFEGLSDEFCRNIIKAAPMHDLGKIAVDDAVLRFEGRYNDRQYAEMKKHAGEGARIVHEILKGTDDIAFQFIAENVAHYHHERWDGSGYPEGLKGEQIPLEARIMAIADVYDALVSKRCYKDSMPFDKADAIIMDGFGTQFDKSLQPYYEAARPKLEEYYRSII